ncbi:o-succinylbenzoate synthase [Candidatus Uhrbacteria bacterium]|nr:o-succinylbenzoate synthase [Candidatus Uhrbacteria bacterium]
MKITRADIISLSVPMIPFTISTGTIDRANSVIFRVYDASGESGMGETPVPSLSIYRDETLENVMNQLEKVIFPAIKDREFSLPAYADDALSSIAGNPFAKCAASTALHDLYGKQRGKTLIELMGGTRTKLDVSKTIGICPTLEDMLAQAKQLSGEGIEWLKLKIKPGTDIAYVRALREAFPDKKLMVDGNGAYVYSQETKKLFQEMDALDLFAVEQPLQADDYMNHAKLQTDIRAPIALDESVTCVSDAEQAMKLGSCKFINIKVPRVGGLTEAMRINRLCVDEGIATWVGGMMELPIGFCVNVAFATLENCSLPTDFMDVMNNIKEYESFFRRMPFSIHHGVCTPDFRTPGIGAEINEDTLMQYAVERRTLS